MRVPDSVRIDIAQCNFAKSIAAQAKMIYQTHLHFGKPFFTWERPKETEGAKQ